MVSIIAGDSVLAIDVGAVNTRAVLFDVVDGRYRFIAIGQSPSTAHAPFNDIGAGIGEAIDRLEEITGRKFIDEKQGIISSIQEDGSGVDAITATFSAGKSLKIVIAGLLSEVSLRSVRKLAETTYGRVVESISLNDPRKAEEQIDAILKAEPELIIIGGGTDQGTSGSLQKIIDVLGLAIYLLPKDKKPMVLFVGNKNATGNGLDTLKKLSSALFIAPNIRPSVANEDLRPARKALARVMIEIRKREIPGADALDMWTGKKMLPSAFAEGRIVQLISKLYGVEKAVLSVNLGASATTISVGHNNTLFSKTYPHLGMGENITDLLKYTSPENIIRWLSMETSPQRISDYTHTKALYPGSIPATKEDLQMEQALGREALRLAMTAAQRELPASVPALAPGLLPLFELILAGGSTLANIPFGHSLLMLIDSLQPVGITEVILDKNSILSALGASAEINSILPVQALETGAFLNLATVISPLSTAAYGTEILNVNLRRSDGFVSTLDVKSGGLELIPLHTGQSAELFLQPTRRTDVGGGVGNKVSIKISGSALGVVIDARGRPLSLTSDDVRRHELLKKWLWTLGG